MWYKSGNLIGQKQKHFSVNTHRKFLKQAGKQARGFLPSDRYFSFFWIIILTMFVVPFILGKCLLNSYQLFLIFTEVWLYNFCISRISDSIFLFPLASD